MENNINKDLVLFNELINLFIEDEKETPVSKFFNPDQLESKLDIRLKKEPISSDSLKAHLLKLILNTPKSSSVKFFNQLYGGRHSKAVLGDLLAVFLNNSMATYKIAGPQVGVEKELLRKICEIIKYPVSSGGTFPTGGSMSNFMSLVMARDRKDPNAKNLGITKKLVAYASKNSHYSFSKNISFAGIGRKNIRYVKTNSKGQICVDDLLKLIERDIRSGYVPFYLNATAGTTVVCAFDKIPELSPICKKYKMWLHLDGAFGGAVIFSKKHKHLVEGVSDTDSFCFNAHKTLGAPLSTSVLVVKNKIHLLNSFKNNASYLYQTHKDEDNLGQTSFECGRRNNALKFWVMWKAIGSNGIEKIIDTQFELANFARDYVRGNKNYRLYNFENSLSVCFNYKDVDPKVLCSKLYEKNKLMIGYGSFNDTFFLRLVTINNQLEKKDIINFFQTLENFVKNSDQEVLTKKIATVKNEI